MESKLVSAAKKMSKMKISAENSWEKKTKKKLVSNRYPSVCDIHEHTCIVSLSAFNLNPPCWCMPCLESDASSQKYYWQ